MTRPNGKIQTRERSAVMSQGSRAMSRPPTFSPSAPEPPDRVARLEKALDRKNCYIGMLEKEMDRLRKRCLDLERSGLDSES